MPARRAALVLTWLGGAAFWLAVASLWTPPPPASGFPPVTPAPSRCTEDWSETPEVQPQQKCWSDLHGPSKRYRIRGAPGVTDDG